MNELRMGLRFTLLRLIREGFAFALFFASVGEFPCISHDGILVQHVQARAVGFWVALCLACIVLVSGLIPWFWRLPELAKVQFPWRLMTVVEFAVITAACTVDFGKLRRPAFWLLVLAVLPLVQSQILAVRYTVQGIVLARPYMPLPRVEGKEYLPHGLPGAERERGDQLTNLLLKGADLLFARVHLATQPFECLRAL